MYQNEKRTCKACRECINRWSYFLSMQICGVRFVIAVAIEYKLFIVIEVKPRVTANGNLLFAKTPAEKFPS